MKKTGNPKVAIFVVILIIFTFVLLFVPTWSLWWRSCYEDVHFDPIVIIFLYLVLSLLFFIVSSLVRWKKRNGPSSLPRKVFHIVAIYNLVTLIYSLVVYPYLLKNNLFWSAFGSYSGVMCHGVGEGARTVFIVENFWGIYLTIILPLSGVLIVLGTLLLRSQEEKVELKKYLLGIWPVVAFLLKLIISLSVVAGSVVFLVIQKQVWDKYEVLDVDGSKSETLGCLLCYFENYKKEKFYFDGTLYDNDLRFDFPGTFQFPGDIFQEYLEDGDITRLDNADKETFEVFRFGDDYISEGYDYYAKDKNQVYCHGKVVENIDSTSIRSYGGDYWGDEDSVYFGCTEVEGIDVATARYLSGYWIRDDNSLYYQTVKLDYAADSVEILEMFKIKVFNKWVYDISLGEDGRVKYRYLKDESVLK